MTINEKHTIYGKHQMRALNQNHLNFKVIITAILFVFLLQGCGTWNNFVTYFNLYYNIKDTFDPAETTIIEQKKDIFSINEPNIPTNLTTPINKVIEKCSNLLQFHNETSFVDNALFIIGKCYYYQRNHQKALRKFQELLATRPNSDLALETKLWIARTNNQLRKFDESVKLLREIRIDSENKKEMKILAFTYIEEVKYAINANKYSDAIALLKELIKKTDFDEINSQAVYKTGELFLLQEDLKNASASFLTVTDYSPAYDVEFNAMLKYSQSQRKLGNTEVALKVLQKLNGENKFYDFRDIIGLELGKAYKSLKRFDDAYKQFYTVDTSFSASVNIGGVRYEMADMFENNLKRFDSAAVYYAKAQVSTSTIEYTTLIRSKNLLFDKYQKLASNNLSYKKQMFYLKNPKEFIKDSIVFYADSILTLFNQPTLIKADTAKVDSATREKNRLDSLKTARVNIDSLKQVILKKKIQDSIDNIGKPVKKKEVRTPPIMPRISADSLNKLSAKTNIDLGNLFFTEFNLPDSAYYYYSYVMTNYDSIPQKAQLLFSLGSYYSTVGDSLKADSLFNHIYDNFKNDKIVNAAAKKIRKPLIDFDFDPGKVAFLEAEKKYKAKSYKEAYTSMYDIYLKYPKSEFASKALYTCGYILEEHLKLKDSAAKVYDSLIVKYPQTFYTQKANPKVQFYKQEIIRIEKAKKDSLKMIEDALKAKSDSLANAKKAIDDSIKNINKTIQDSLAVKKQADSLKTSPIPKDSLSTIKTKTKDFPNKLPDSLKNSTTPKDSLIKSAPTLQDNQNIPIENEELKDEKPESSLLYYDFKRTNFYLSPYFKC